MDQDKKFVIRCRAVIMHEGKLLVVTHPHDTTFVALPGGHLEWGEDIRECLKREVAEELGVPPEIGRLLYINNFTQTDGKQSIEFFFEVTNGDQYVGIQKVIPTHAHEIAMVNWVSPGENVRILPEKLGEDFKAGKILSDKTRLIDIMEASPETSVYFS